MRLVPSKAGNRSREIVRRGWLQRWVRTRRGRLHGLHRQRRSNPPFKKTPTEARSKEIYHTPKKSGTREDENNLSAASEEERFFFFPVLEKKEETQRKKKKKTKALPRLSDPVTPFLPSVFRGVVGRGPHYQLHPKTGQNVLGFLGKKSPSKKRVVNGKSKTKGIPGPFFRIIPWPPLISGGANHRWPTFAVLFSHFPS